MAHESIPPEMPPQVQKLLDTNISRLTVADLYRLEKQITAAFTDIEGHYDLYEPLSAKIIEIQEAIKVLHQSEEQKIMEDQPPTPEDWNEALQESNFKYWQKGLRNDLSTFSPGELSDYVSWLRTTIQYESDKGDNEYTRRYIETATAELERIKEWQEKHVESVEVEEKTPQEPTEAEKAEAIIRDEARYIDRELVLINISKSSLLQVEVDMKWLRRKLEWAQRNRQDDLVEKIEAKIKEGEDREKEHDFIPGQNLLPMPDELLRSDLSGKTRTELVALRKQIDDERVRPGRTQIQQDVLESKIREINYAIIKLELDQKLQQYQTYPKERLRGWIMDLNHDLRRAIEEGDVEFEGRIQQALDAAQARIEEIEREEAAQAALVDAMVPPDATPEQAEVAAAAVREKWEFFKNKRIMGQSIKDIAVSMVAGAAMSIVVKTTLRVTFGLGGVVLGGVAGASAGLLKKWGGAVLKESRYEKAEKILKGEGKEKPQDIVKMVKKGQLSVVDAFKLLKDRKDELSQLKVENDEEEAYVIDDELTNLKVAEALLPELQSLGELPVVKRLDEYMDLIARVEGEDKKVTERREEIEYELALYAGRELTLKQIGKAALIGAIGGAVGYTVGHFVSEYISTHFASSGDIPQHGGGARPAGGRAGMPQSNPSAGTTPGAGRSATGAVTDTLRPRASVDTVPLSTDTVPAPSGPSTPQAEAPSPAQPEAPVTPHAQAPAPEGSTSSPIRETVSSPGEAGIKLPPFPQTLNVEVDIPDPIHPTLSVEDVTHFDRTVPAGSLYDRLHGPFSNIDTKHLQVSEVLQVLADAHFPPGPELDAALALHHMEPSLEEAEMTVEDFLNHRIPSEATLPADTPAPSSPHMTVRVTPVETAEIHKAYEVRAPEEISSRSASARASAEKVSAPVKTPNVPPAAPPVEAVASNAPAAPEVQNSAPVSSAKPVTPSPVEKSPTSPVPKVTDGESDLKNWLLIGGGALGLGTVGVGVGVGVGEVWDRRTKRKLERVEDVGELKKLSDYYRSLKLFDTLNPGRKKPRVLDKKELAVFKKVFKEEGNGAVFKNLLSFMETKTESQRQEIVKAAIVFSTYNDATATLLPRFLSDVQNLPPAPPEIAEPHGPSSETLKKKSKKELESEAMSAITLEQIAALTEEQKVVAAERRLFPGGKPRFWKRKERAKWNAFHDALKSRRPQDIYNVLLGEFKASPSMGRSFIREAAEIVSTLPDKGGNAYEGFLERVRLLIEEEQKRRDNNPTS